jgi:hypothetical protein
LIINKVAKKFLFPSGPVWTSNDIASKRGFLANLSAFRELKRFLRYNAGGIWIKIHLNPRWNFRYIQFSFYNNSLHGTIRSEDPLRCSLTRLKVNYCMQEV